MVREIGRVALLVLYTSFLAAQIDSVSFFLVNLQGHEIERVAAGQSAILKIVIEGNEDAHKLEVKGLESLHVEPRGNFKQVMSINGVTTEKLEYNFLIRSKKTGHFNVGPLYLGSTKIEEYFMLTVSDAPASSVASNESVFIEYTCHNEQPVVGQKVPVTVTFYATKPLQIEEITLPPSDSEFGEFSPLKKELEGIKAINGEDYRFCSWTTELVVHKPGKVLVPECTARCRFRKERGAHLFGGLLFDMLGSYEEKIVCSKPIILNVKPLPVHDKPLHGIGNLYDFRLFCDKTTLSTDDGVALTLQVSSDEYMDTVKRPELVLPEGIKAYNSSERMYQTQHGYTKTFEYILQPMEAGEFAIPSQELTHYDPQEEQYTTMKTDPFLLSVSQGIGQLVVEGDQKNEEGAVQETSILAPLNEKGPWSFRPERQLPTWLFLLVSISSLLYIGYSFLAPFREQYQVFYVRYRRRKNPLWFARKQLKKIKMADAPDELYNLFYTLLSTQGVVVSDSGDSSPLDQLKKNEREEWELFLLSVEQARYSNDGIDSKHLFILADAWLDRLSKLI